MIRKEVFELVKKYNKGLCTPEEEHLFESWYVKQTRLYQQELSEAEIEKAVNDTYKALSAQLPQKTKLWLRFAAVACMAIVVGLGLYFYSIRHSKPKGHVELLGADIAPGKNMAVLHLPNGQTVPLGDKHQGVALNIGELSDAGGPVLNSWPSAKQNKGNPNAQVQTIVVPIGGQYKVELPDRTKVWLKSASSLTYSPYLGKRGSTRTVKLEGEAYFEVAKNKKLPFIVETRKPNGQLQQTVEVLGTHFRISSYADEAEVKTTLLEGSIKVKNSQQSLTLEPGQQSVLASANQLSIRQINLDLANWQEDKFSFDNASLETILRELSRWYAVEVRYKKDLPNRHFSGHIDRSLKLSEVLEILAKLGIDFTIARQTIIVDN